LAKCTPDKSDGYSCVDVSNRRSHAYRPQLGPVTGLDVALLFLGAGDLGAANLQLIYHGTVDTTQTITKYGRGYFAFATPTVPNPTPAQRDGLYRSGRFTPSSSGETFITVQPNSAGQIPSGGDSGGPDFVTAPNGVAVGIAGVQSSCVATGWLSATFSWLWATGISSCTSAGLGGIRSDILDVIRERPIASNDFNDDNLPDIVWHNAATAETQIWFMKSSSRIGRATVVDEGGRVIRVGLPWRIVATRDFNRDNQTDILWYKNDTGELQVWFMTGFAIRSRATILGENGSPVFIGPPFSVVGANDMDGDRYADIVWHNAQTGETQLWFMNGTKLARRATVLGDNGIPIMVGAPFSIVATGDTNRDRKPDIIWHNAASGETQIWFMNAERLIGRRTVFREFNASPAFVRLPWRIAGANDFDGDNIADILWHNDLTGEAQIWYLFNGWGYHVH